MQNFDSFLHFGQVLAGVLDHGHIPVSSVFDVFVQRYEGVQLEISFLLLLGQIKDQKLFYFELLLSLSGLSHSAGSRSSHFFSKVFQELDVFIESVFSLFHCDDQTFHFLLGLVLLRKFFVQSFISKSFFDEVSHKQLIFFLNVLFVNRLHFDQFSLFFYFLLGRPKLSLKNLDLRFVQHELGLVHFKVGLLIIDILFPLSLGFGVVLDQPNNVENLMVQCYPVLIYRLFFKLHIVHFLA